jgi:cytosine/adenosine deaminase-related metal-dependent hydrolase
MNETLIHGCDIATVDAQGSEHPDGWIHIAGGHVAGLGAGAPPNLSSAERIDASGCLATPGLVNCHHHLYQWATRGLAQEGTLFEWLVALYPAWARIDVEVQADASLAALAALARSGCSLSTDHHYVFPRGGGDLLGAEIASATQLGLRFHPCRGSMDLGRSAGGLPPDEAVEDRDAILEATSAAIDTWHDPSPDSMLQIAVAPCSPFSVTRELMVEAAELARRRGVRLHTHLAETLDEEAFCIERFGRRPVEYLEELGWLGPDVWLAHCVHLSEREIRRFAQTGTGVAHCPSSNARLGAGIAPVAELIAAGASVGLGVDGAASNEQGELSVELRQALYMARVRGGPAALSARQALALGTIHGARCLGRERDLGSLEVGKLADIALWRIDGASHAGIIDPVAAMVFGPTHRVETLLVGGRRVVERGHLTGADEDEIARGAERATRRLAARLAAA